MGSSLEDLITERRNPRSRNLDQKSSREILKIMNEEDKKVAKAVEKELPRIAQAVDQIAVKLEVGGRLVYVGAGTSGRLGILDAVECPPTFGVDDNKVVGLMAGGGEAFGRAKEGEEDNREEGQKDLEEIEFDHQDCLVGLTSSGRTPYVLGALEYANQVEALTVSLNCNPNSAVSKIADIGIECIVGPEIIAGSTRLKAGTAQKMVLNMISTGVMIKLGKVYDNLMVDIKPTNQKLTQRAKRIVKLVTDISNEKAKELLEQADYQPKAAIVMQETGCNYQEAKERLQKSRGFVRQAIEGEGASSKY